MGVYVDDLHPLRDFPLTPTVRQPAGPSVSLPPTPPVTINGMAAAVLAPGGRNCLIGKRPFFEVGFGSFNMPHAHSNLSV